MLLSKFLLFLLSEQAKLPCPRSSLNFIFQVFATFFDFRFSQQSRLSFSNVTHHHFFIAGITSFFFVARLAHFFLLCSPDDSLSRILGGRIHIIVSSQFNLGHYAQLS